MSLWAEQFIVHSPDGKLSVLLAAEDGLPTYSVIYGDKVFLKPSPLGLRTSVGDFTQGLSLNTEVLRDRVEETYRLPTIKQSEVRYQANCAVFQFSHDKGPAFDLEIQVSDHDIAFRYVVHPQDDYRSCVVHEEVTGFLFPEGTTTFLSPMMEPMTGFARTGPSYETPYFGDRAMGENGWGYGYIFPGLFKVNERGWVLVSETGVDSSYCGGKLVGHPGGLYTIGFPDEAQNNGNGTSSPGIALPGKTPWRTLTVGKTLKPIVETTIPFDVVEPLYPASQEYRFGRGTWSWIIKMDDSMNFDEQQNYIDFAAAMGYEYVLVDAWWDTRIGREGILELVDYAKEKNVELFLWYNTNGYWNDAPQTPRDRMHRAIPRRAEMKWLQDIRVKGIKVDFFGGDKQVTMQLYEDILYDANEHGLMVVFHGCTLPRGWERMFPNFVSSEAVLASEMLHFSQERCDEEAVQASMHPFIRNAVGSMDFGGSALNQFYNADNTPNVGTQRRTSDVFALATAVLFQSPIQFFALAPNNLEDAPEWAIEFMKEVPTTWDETIFLDGYPGRYVVLARRSGDHWYVAGINAMDEMLELEVGLPMLSDASGELRLYADDANLKGSLSSVQLSPEGSIKLSIPRNGGALLVD